MAKTQGKVHSIISNLVLVKVEGPVSQNEICFIEENGLKHAATPSFPYRTVPE